MLHIIPFKNILAVKEGEFKKVQVTERLKDVISIINVRPRMLLNCIDGEATCLKLYTFVAS